jgi:diguanylate cyclase (GGDEF)-like protein
VEQHEADLTSATLISAVAAALAHAGDLDTAVATIADAATSALGVELVAVFARDPDEQPADGGGLELVESRGLPGDGESAFAAAVRSGPHPIAQVARTREPAWGREAASEAGTLVAADLPLAVTRDGVDVPLGVVSFGWPEQHEITHVERGLATAIADLLAVAIDRARLATLVTERSEWYERMSQSDALTGLANARTLGRVLELEVARASRQSSGLAVAIFDVDRFATLNEAAGKAVGDDVLRAVASVLAQSVRLVDTVARWGGDEFVLVAPGTAGTTVAERVLEGVASLPAIDGTAISVSAGVARFPADGATADELISSAHDALARAKDAGGGRLEPSGADAAG